MKPTPRVLVVAREREGVSAGEFSTLLAGQTYPQLEHYIWGGSDAEEPTEQAFADILVRAGADYVLFWPEDGSLRPAAIEKLVLALQVCPDRDGVADAQRGATGLWLARHTSETRSWLALWLQAQVRWIGETLRRKAPLFFIDEDLMVAPDLAKRSYAVESYFEKLPLRLKNLEQIAVEALWDFPEETPDPDSVLLLVNSLPMGGACKFILDVAAQLTARGKRVVVATTTYDPHNPNPWLNELLQRIPGVFVLSHTRPIDLPRLIVHLARSRRCGRVVISHCMLGYQLLAWLRTQLPGVAFVDYTHIEYETEWPDGGFALRSLSYQPLLDLALVSSEHLRGWMIERGAASDAVRVCHTNIDTEKWTPSHEILARVRYELNMDAKTAMVLYPCRLAEQKRPGMLCNIVAALRHATSAPFVVVIAGDGPLMTPIKNFIAREGLADCVRLLGAVSLERVKELHIAADILLLPSQTEGISLALFEAMALESVPVISDVGGQRELVTPKCGFLVPITEPVKEVAAYVSILRHLLENPTKRKTLAAAARRRVADHFRLEQMTDTFLAALDEAGIVCAARMVPLPDARFAREVATIAMDHQVRLSLDNSVKLEALFLFKEQSDKQEKIITKLERKIETLRSAVRHEENELAC